MVARTIVCLVLGNVRLEDWPVKWKEQLPRSVVQSLGLFLQVASLVTPSTEQV